MLGEPSFEEMEVGAADADRPRANEHLAGLRLAGLGHVADAHHSDRFRHGRDHRSVLCTASTIAAASGRYASSSGGLNGMGANGAPTRCTGASSWSNAAA